MRTINKDLLREKIRSVKYGRQKTADAAGCSVHTVGNWLKPDYDGGLAEYHAQAVAAFWNVNINKLFPPVAAGGKRAS